MAINEIYEMTSPQAGRRESLPSHGWLMDVTPWCRLHDFNSAERLDRPASNLEGAELELAGRGPSKAQAVTGNEMAYAACCFGRGVEN
jgi:hypothetical protein